MRSARKRWSSPASSVPGPRDDGGGDDLAQVAVRQAHDRGLQHVGMRADHALDLERGDLLPAAVDQLVDPAQDAKEAVGPRRARSPVRSQGPSASRGSPLILPVAGHRGRAVDQELAVRSDPVPRAGHGDSDRREVTRAGPPRQVVRDRRRLRHPVDVDQARAGDTSARRVASRRHGRAAVGEPGRVVRGRRLASSSGSIRW